ncbi:MAG TPA: YceD family protein [Steroidobacteraceae bacterium]
MLDQCLKNNDLRRICFDTPGGAHYHTAPMPTTREQPLDVLDLAATGGVVERQFPIAGLERLRDRLADPGGSVQMRLELQMIDGTPSAVLQIRAGVVQECQRCLRPLRRVLESESRLAFVARDDSPVPADHEPVIGDPRRVDLATLIEDELLLAVPLIAKHAPGEECRLPALAGAGKWEPAPAAQEMRRPFAGLKDLMKH